MAVLAIPVLLMIGGAVSCALGYPHVMLILLGVLICAVGFYVRPRRPIVKGRFYTRDDLPELFTLLDQVAERLGGEPVTKVQFDANFNATSIECVGDRVIGIGFALWQILSPEERVALIAHEVSHQVNGDQARTGVLQMGLHSVESWHSLCSSSRIIDHEGYYLREEEAEDIIGRGILWVFATMFEQLWVVLTRLSFLDSQRAEYFADGVAARAAGREAAVQLLGKLGYMPLLERGFLEMAPNMIPSGTAYFDQLCHYAIDPSQAVRETLRDKMRDERHSVDNTHPPTLDRIGFLEDMGDEATDPIEYSSAIDAELAPFIEVEGRRQLERLEVQ